MKQLAHAAVRQVLTSERNPVLRLVEIAYDDSVPVETQVAAATAAAPFLFPKKSLDVTATVALEAPHANLIIEKLLGRIASLPNAAMPVIEGERPKEIAG